MEAIFFIAVGLHTWTSVTGYSNGAPSATCTTMQPEHGAAAQTSSSPYTIKTNSNGTFWSNRPIKVTIDGPEYVGLLLQARSPSSNNAFGTWEAPPENTKFLSCSENGQGAITHANKNAKNNLTVYTWTPPATLDSVFFTATVVRNKTVFWLNLRSATLSKAPDGTVSPGGSAADPRLTFTPALLLFALLTATIFYS